jgi:hypothetical protein
MASISKQQCIRCFKYFNITFFTSHTGRNLKTCTSCREKLAATYQTNHPHKDTILEHLYWNDFKEKLHDKIIEIGNNEYLENKENGISFSCILIMENELLKEEPCSIAKQVVKLVEQADGYYYV